MDSLERKRGSHLESGFFLRVFLTLGYMVYLLCMRGLHGQGHTQRGRPAGLCKEASPLLRGGFFHTKEASFPTQDFLFMQTKSCSSILGFIKNQDHLRGAYSPHSGRVFCAASHYPQQSMNSAATFTTAERWVPPISVCITSHHSPHRCWLQYAQCLYYLGTKHTCQAQTLHLSEPFPSNSSPQISQQ